MAKIELIGGHIGIKLIIKMAKIEINRRPYWIILNIHIALIELIGGHIEIMLIIEMAKIELIGGHIGIKLIIKIAKIEINWRPYWIILDYIKYTHCLNRINWRPY